MTERATSLVRHRARSADNNSVVDGKVRYAPAKSLWFIAMACAAAIGGATTFSAGAFGVFAGSTAAVLLLGHSLGSHRKLIHNSYQCPQWLEYLLVYLGVQVGLAGPLGLLRQHELRDYAQRLPTCHDYLRHGRGLWTDAWWQLNCELRLISPPHIELESRVADDRFYLFLERTWMLQQVPPALLLYWWGGWGFVFWGVCAAGAAVQGRSIHLTSLMTMGECWHNNHHAYMARLARRSWVRSVVALTGQKSPSCTAFR
jgi:stearoyl-CoA desaturase (delta-9 desaturase)